MQNDYDIIIIGGGLVGASLALALANSELNIAIIEAQPERSIDADNPDARSIVLSYATQKIFTTLAIWDQLQPYLTPIDMIHISDKGHFGVTRIKASEHDVADMGNSISVLALAETLFSVLKKASNVSWIQPANVTQINDNSIIINDKHLTATLLIAADGGNSTIRKLLGIDANITDYDQSAVVTNITLNNSHKHIAYERFTPTGPIALIPYLHNRVTAVCTTSHQQAQQLMALAEPDFLSALQQQFGYRAGKFIAASKQVCYPLNLSVSTQQMVGKVLILGNAAHALHPVSGQGFNLSLRDVAQLAEDILSVDKANIGNQPLLATYIEKRQDDQQATIQYTDDLVRLFSSDIFPITPLRSMALHELNNLPIIKNIIVKRAMGLRGTASKLLRGIKI